MKILKILIHMALLQAVFMICGPHWLIGGLLCSFIHSCFRTSDSAVSVSAPVSRLNSGRPS